MSFRPGILQKHTFFFLFFPPCNVKIWETLLLMWEGWILKNSIIVDKLSYDSLQKAVDHFSKVIWALRYLSDVVISTFQRT